MWLSGGQHSRDAVAGGRCPRSIWVAVAQSLKAPVKKLLVLVGTTLGSAAGWWLASDLGIMTAFIVSMVGFGLGMWAGARLARNLEG
jgi:hypothetical protein